MDTVSIKINTGVYGQFRNLNNKIWFALGEYVDNAVQSYESNKVHLQSVNQGRYQFEVRIDINWELNSIRILDNAAGIDTNNFQRAFEPANIPIDNSGLNEFGMGMKTASIWLADIWSVRTSALNEKIERFVEFNLPKVLEQKKEVLNVKSCAAPKMAHYTELLLHNLSKNAPSAFQMDKIKKHLASIYRKFIRNGEMKLFINEEELNYKEPDILIAPPHNAPDENPVRWKKDIYFSSGKYKVEGFIAILNTMSTNEINGLSLFRRGRVVEGSHDEKYRPKSICGQIGSPRYKRIFGELELEGFTVSFNKGSFQEHDDLEALMDAVRIEISSKDLDLYNQAEKYIKPKTVENNIRVAKKIVKAMKKTSTGSEWKNKIATSVKDIDDKHLADKNEKLSISATIIDSHEDIIEIKDSKYKLVVDLITEPSITSLYTLHLENDELFTYKVRYKINLSHPFFNRYDNLKNEVDYQPIISIIRSLVLAEIVAPSQGTKNAGNIRINFNNFLRNI